jgi:teichuronic acid biosynthesis glycosyltransferase TuaG
MKKINNPLVSIIMPTFNSFIYIEDAIYSVIKQTYSNWELIIVDDNSTDGTKEILNKYRNESKIIIIYLQRNQGAANARQIGINISKGNLVSFLDSDDFWYPNKLKDQVEFMINNNYDFTYTLYSPFKDSKNIYSPVKYSKSKNYMGILIHSPGNSTVMINGNLTRGTKIPIIKRRNDYLYFLQLIKVTKKAYLLNKTLTLYRLNQNGLSRNKLNLIKYNWIVYRKYEKLSLFISICLIIIIILRKISSLFYTKF